MASQSFENRRVYRLSEDMADSIWEIVVQWPTLARDTVGKQIVRSADSVGANIAGCSRRGSFQDNRRFVKYTRGSLYETRHWLRRAFKRRLLSQDQIADLKPVIDNFGPQLNAYLKSIGRSSPPKSDKSSRD